MRNKIYNLRFHIGGQQGCCGIGTISRLRGNYCSPAEMKADTALWKSRKDALPVLHNSRLRERWTMEHILNSAHTIWPGGTVPPHHYYFKPMAVNANIAFSSILDNCRESHYAIYFLSDNMSNEGDVHNGQFNTKNFVNWLVINNLGSFHTSGPVTSHVTSRPIQGWIWVPHWPSISDKIKLERDNLEKLIKELNSDKKLKEKGQIKISTQAREARAFASTLTSGW